MFQQLKSWNQTTDKVRAGYKAIGWPSPKHHTKEPFNGFHLFCSDHGEFIFDNGFKRVA